MILVLISILILITWMSLTSRIGRTSTPDSRDWFGVAIRIAALLILISIGIAHLLPG